MDEVELIPVSDPSTPDFKRFGDDLLMRIDELTREVDKSTARDGWRPLLLACEAEIRGLRRELGYIRDCIQKQERKRDNVKFCEV